MLMSTPIHTEFPDGEQYAYENGYTVRFVYLQVGFSRSCHMYLYSRGRSVSYDPLVPHRVGVGATLMSRLSMPEVLEFVSSLPDAPSAEHTENFLRVTSHTLPHVTDE